MTATCPTHHAPLVPMCAACGHDIITSRNQHDARSAHLQASLQAMEQRLVDMTTAFRLEKQRADSLRVERDEAEARLSTLALEAGRVDGRAHALQVALVGVENIGRAAGIGGRPLSAAIAEMSVHARCALDADYRARHGDALTPQPEPPALTWRCTCYPFGSPAGECRFGGDEPCACCCHSGHRPGPVPTPPVQASGEEPPAGARVLRIGSRVEIRCTSDGWRDWEPATVDLLLRDGIFSAVAKHPGGGRYSSLVDLAGEGRAWRWPAQEPPAGQGGTGEGR